MAGSHPYMQYGMDQRPMNWQQSDQLHSPNNVLAAAANILGIDSRAASGLSGVNNQMNYTGLQPPPQYGSYSQQSTPRQQPFEVQVAQLLFGALNECNMQQNNTQVPQSLEKQFEKRRMFQQFLARQCTNQGTFNYVTSSDFLCNMHSPGLYDFVGKVTGVEQQNLKQALQTVIASAARNMRPQVNQNTSHGNQLQQNHRTGNFSQFQVHGFENSGNHTGTLPSSRTNHMALSSSSTYQPYVSQQNAIPATSQQTRCWYSSPKETYKNGRVVKLDDRHSPQQIPPSQVPHQNTGLVPNGNNSAQQILPHTSMPQEMIQHNETHHTNINGWVSNERILTQHKNLQQSISQARNVVGTPSFESLSASSHLGNTDSLTGDSNFQSYSIQPRLSPVISNPSTNFDQTNKKSNPRSEPEIVNIEPFDHNIAATVEQSTRNFTTAQDLKKQLKEKHARSKASSVKQSSNEKTAKTTSQSPVEQIQSSFMGKSTEKTGNESSVNANPDDDDVLEILSMPVLNEDPVSIAIKKPASKRTEILPNFDDMSVLSPFTADVVSDSVNTWLSGSKRSEILDRVGLKSVKEKQSTSKGPKDCSKSDNAELEPVAEKMGSKANETIDVVKAPNAHKSLGEYDPPLPVIRHKKREDRISPLKKALDVVIDTEMESQPAKDKKQQGEEGKTGTNREPLFSVLDNLLTKTPNQTESQICSKETNKQDIHTREDHNQSPVSQDKVDHRSKAKHRHKSSEVSSSSSPRYEETSDKLRKSCTMIGERDSKHKMKRDDGKKEGSLPKERRHHSSGSKKSHDGFKEQSSGGGAREKVRSAWSVQHKENEKDPKHVAKNHVRRKSCPDDENPQRRPNKGRRSYTWDGNSSTDQTVQLPRETDKCSPSVPSGLEFVWLHGQKMLLLDIPGGKHIVLEEFVAVSLPEHAINDVYKVKTSELEISHKPLIHGCKRDVQKYLRSKDIKCQGQIGVISLLHAQKLCHRMKGVKSCDERCISFKPVTDFVFDTDIEKKGRSASPDSTVIGDNRSSGTKRLSEEGVSQRDLQQNKVSSQSMDTEDTLQEDDDASSSVSDATDLYCDGKPVPLESLCVSADGGGDSNRLLIDFDGGLAELSRENIENSYIRFVNIRGNKCFLYQDLFQLFGRTEVVQIVLRNYMKVKVCTKDEADFLNRQSDLDPVDHVDASLIQEKYVRKIFNYFGETFPKLKLPINAELNKFKLPSKRVMDETLDEPPAKKLRQDQATTKELSSPGDDELHNEQLMIEEVRNAEKCGLKRKLEDISVEDGSTEEPNNDSRECDLNAFFELKAQHLELADEVAALQAELESLRRNNDALEERCQIHEADLTLVKAELEDANKKNSDWQEKYRSQEDKLEQMRVELEAKEEENRVLTTERDHCKAFLEQITDTYAVADDSGEETKHL